MMKYGFIFLLLITIACSSKNNKLEILEDELSELKYQNEIFELKLDSILNETTHFVGERLNSGIVFYVFQDSLGEQHGLIVDLVDVEGKFNWQKAVKVCESINHQGKTDWYLPSNQELQVLWNNYYPVSLALSAITGAEQLKKGRLDAYWTNTRIYDEWGSKTSWIFTFRNGVVGSTFNYNQHRVRAIRKF